MSITPEFEATYGPNVVNIIVGGTRVIRGRVPAQVRAELRKAVKAGVLGHLKKDGLKPEIFFDPNHPGKHAAIERQKREEEYARSCIAGVIATPAQVREGLEAMGIDPLQHALSERVARSA